VGSSVLRQTARAGRPVQCLPPLASPGTLPFRRQGRAFSRCLNRLTSNSLTYSAAGFLTNQSGDRVGNRS
jgi:hypothetical protein